MILFDNWTIWMFPETAPFAQQYDDGSRRVDVEGDLPEGYTWQLLVQCGDSADTILLTPTQKGVGAVLGADNLSLAGSYDLQLAHWRLTGLQSGIPMWLVALCLRA